MEAGAEHVVIVGGPEAEDELLAIVLDQSEEAVPLFDSVEEAEYVALSPPPENLEGGMEVQLLYREILTDLLRRQTAAQARTTETSSEHRGLWRRLFGR